MGNKVRTRILLRRGKGAIHMILHIPRRNICRTLVNFGGLPMLKFLMDMQPLVRLKDNVHIYSSKSHKLNCGNLIHLSLFLCYGVKAWRRSLNKENNWKNLEKLLVSMIACIIRSKTLVPHVIIQVR